MTSFPGSPMQSAVGQGAQQAIASQQQNAANAQQAALQGSALRQQGDIAQKQMQQQGQQFQQGQAQQQQQFQQAQKQHASEAQANIDASFSQERMQQEGWDKQRAFQAEQAEQDRKYQQQVRAQQIEMEKQLQMARLKMARSSQEERGQVAAEVLRLEQETADRSLKMSRAQARAKAAGEDMKTQGVKVMDDFSTFHQGVVEQDRLGQDIGSQVATNLSTELAKDMASGLMTRTSMGKVLDPTVEVDQGDSLAGLKMGVAAPAQKVMGMVRGAVRGGVEALSGGAIDIDQGLYEKSANFRADSIEKLATVSLGAIEKSMAIKDPVGTKAALKTLYGALIGAQNPTNDPSVDVALSDQVRKAFSSLEGLGVSTTSTMAMLDRLGTEANRAGEVVGEANSREDLEAKGAKPKARLQEGVRKDFWDLTGRAAMSAKAFMHGAYADPISAGITKQAFQDAFERGDDIDRIRELIQSGGVDPSEKRLLDRIEGSGMAGKNLEIGGLMAEIEQLLSGELEEQKAGRSKVRGIQSKAEAERIRLEEESLASIYK